MDQTPISVSGSTRKRARENETESQRHKREKAAERQRRKRERDRQAGLNNLLMSQVHQQQQQQQQPPPIQQQPPPQEDHTMSAPAAFHNQDSDKDGQLSPDDAAKRERVRAAARERQRKHRALVKQKKLRELGLDMGNELLPNMEEVQYRLNADGQYQPMLQELQQHAQHHPQQHMHEPPFPQGQPLGGQTFASTLLLSFSCAPLLKAHLLRTLNMSNEELASLEPIIAQAWDHWDQQRRMHFAQHPNNAPKPPDAPQPVPDGSVSAPFNTIPPHPHPYVHDPTQGSPNDFRARFHRSLVAPVPFRTGVITAEPQQPGINPSSSAPVSAQGAAAPPGNEPMDTTNANLDPQLGQARDEAVGVAKQLERS